MLDCGCESSDPLICFQLQYDTFDTSDAIVGGCECACHNGFESEDGVES